jgi:hypothetical protein
MNVPSSLLSILSCAFIAIAAHSTSFATTVTVEVPSTIPWSDTGIDIVSGQLLQIDASGTVRFDTTSIAGADPNGVGPGWDGTQTVPGDPVPTAIHLSLIGRIGAIHLRGHEQPPLVHCAHRLTLAVVLRHCCLFDTLAETIIRKG